MASIYRHPETNQLLSSGQKEVLLTHDLGDYFPILSKCRSSSQLFASKTYKDLKKNINEVMNGVEYGLFAEVQPYEKKPFYRALAWNLERGIHHEGILNLLKNHPEMARADILFLTETDIGMARTDNKNIARDLAKSLGFNYVFAPAYLNLCKGNAVEGHYQGENELSLHGNVFMSRFPIENIRTVSLKNCKDKMKGKEKRIGCQKAILVDVAFPFKKVTCVVAHLDAHSSQRQRASQMTSIMNGLEGNRHPVLLGGDLNTSTYNARKAFYAFCGFWERVLIRGVDVSIEDHYPYPDRRYDRRMFKVLLDNGFDYESFNELGVGTLHYQVEDIKGNSLVQEVVPKWCQRIMEETLRRHGGKVSLKLDWFAGKRLKLADPNLEGVSPPKVLPGLKYQGHDLSDHDPILVDIDVYSHE